MNTVFQLIEAYASSMRSTPVSSMPATPVISVSATGSLLVSAIRMVSAKIAMAILNLCGRCSPVG